MSSLKIISSIGVLSIGCAVYYAHSVNREEMARPKLPELTLEQKIDKLKLNQEKALERCTTSLITSTNEESIASCERYVNITYEENLENLTRSFSPQEKAHRDALRQCGYIDDYNASISCMNDSTNIYINSLD